MVERDDFSFPIGELSITSTEEIEAGENFLNSNPEDISLVRKKKVKQETAEQEEEEVEDEKGKKDDKSKARTQVKEVVQPKREISEDDLFGSFNEQPEEEEVVEEEEEPVQKKDPKKTAGQKVQEKAEEPIQENKEEASQDENVFSTITKELLGHGIFNLDEEEDDLEITTGEELLQRFQLEAVKQARFTIDKFIGRFGEDYQRMFENVFVHGVHPSEYLSHHNRIEDIGNIDIEDEGNQERIVREMFRSQNRSAEYIDKAISRMKQYGDLADEAKEAQRLLVEKEQQEIEQAKAQKANEQQRKQQIREEYLQNVNQILSDKLKSGEYDGIPVNRKFAEETFQYLTKEKYQTAAGQLLTEFDKDVLDLNRPDKHELKVKLAMLYQLLKRDPTLSSIAKKTIAKESSELFQGLKKKAMKTGSAPTKQEEDKPVSWFRNKE